MMLLIIMIVIIIMTGLDPADLGSDLLGERENRVSDM